MELYGVKNKNNKIFLLSLFLISALLIIDSNYLLLNTISISSRSNIKMSEEVIDIEIIDIPLAISSQSMEPQSNTTLSAATRQKRVVDEVAVFAGDSVTGLKTPSADGKVTYNNEYADIDLSNTSQGYIMIKYKSTDKSLARIVRITNANTGLNYDYYLNTLNEYIAFPLTDGNGSYTVGVFEQVGTKYAMKNNATFKVSIEDDMTQYLYPSYYINYNKDSKAVKMAKYLCNGLTTELQKVEEIYNYVIDNITYDFDLAANMPTGYVPNLDRVITEKTGVCFDYASLMTAMLRSVGVSTKLVFGYTSDVYHAWISVYVKDVGWVDSIIQFDGKSWKLMDPTFAASSSVDSGIMDYIGNGKNYTVRFTY